MYTMSSENCGKQLEGMEIDLQQEKQYLVALLQLLRSFEVQLVLLCCC